MTDVDGVPAVLAIAWGMVVAPSRGPKRELSHESIVDAAVEIADEEGLSAVTMQRVAGVFGFTTMALYRYVASKDDLRMLMLDRLSAEVGDAIVDSTDWRSGLRDWAVAVRDCYSRHPWLVSLAGASADSLRVPSPIKMSMPGFMASLDRGLRALRTLDCDLGYKFDAFEQLSVIAADAVNARAAGTQSTLPADAIAAIRDVAGADRFPDLYPLLEDGGYFTFGAQVDPDERFFEALEVVTDSLAALAKQGTAPGSLPEPQLSEADKLAVAEREWREAVTLRKALAQRLAAATKAESVALRDRDRAREAAKATRRRST